MISVFKGVYWKTNEFSYKADDQAHVLAEHWTVGSSEGMVGWEGIQSDLRGGVCKVIDHYM